MQLLLMPCSCLLPLLLALTASTCHSYPINPPPPSRSSALSLSSKPSSLLDELQSAALHRNIDKRRVIECIEGIESAPSSSSPESLKGTWELVFSSLIPSGYFPIQELCDFYAFSLRSSWGPIPLGGFVGDSRITSAKPLVGR